MTSYCDMVGCVDCKTQIKSRQNPPALASAVTLGNNTIASRGPLFPNEGLLAVMAAQHLLALGLFGLSGEAETLMENREGAADDDEE